MVTGRWCAAASGPDRMVRTGGVEPPRSFPRQILSLVRLPIPPRSLGAGLYKMIASWRFRSLIAQRGKRVDPGSPPRRNMTGQRRRQAQHQRDAYQCERVPRRSIPNRRSHQPGKALGRDQSGAVGTDIAQDLAWADVEAHILDHRDTVEPLGEMADFQHAASRSPIIDLWEPSDSHRSREECSLVYNRWQSSTPNRATGTGGSVE